MKIIEKIKFKVKKKKVREIKLFGISIIRYKLIKYKNRFFKNKLFFLPINYHKKSKQVFYLKINRNDDIAYSIFQQWIDIVHYINAEYYILCDKDDIKQQIYKRINFHDYDIKFIKSDYVCLKNIVKQLTNKIWFNAGCAHLTTFKHSQNKYNSFWNIDADDTLFCVDNKKMSKILVAISDYAEKNNIACFSLDMWKTITNNEHWSFGITYVNNKIDWLKVINNKLNEKEYEKEKNNWNIDWFFTYLKKVTNYRIETFYIENLKFIHYGNFLVQPVGAYFYQWKNGNLMLPNITNVFNVANDKIKRLAIPDEIIKFDYNISEQEDFQYINSKGNG